MKRRYVNNISRDLQIHSGKCRYIYYFIIFYLYSDYSVCRKIRDTNIQNINVLNLSEMISKDIVTSILVC